MASFFSNVYVLHVLFLDALFVIFQI